LCLQSKPPRARDTCRRYQGTGRPQAAYQKVRRQFGTHQPPRVCGVSGRGDSLSAHATRKPSNHRPSLRLRDRSAPSTASDLVLTTRNGTLRAELQRRVRPSRVVTILQRIEPPRGDKGALTEAAASRGLRPRNAVLRCINLNALCSAAEHARFRWAGALVHVVARGLSGGEAAGVALLSVALPGRHHT
jgi:hypothetical protein